MIVSAISGNAKRSIFSSIFSMPSLFSGNTDSEEDGAESAEVDGLKTIAIEIRGIIIKFLTQWPLTSAVPVAAPLCFFFRAYNVPIKSTAIPFLKKTTETVPCLVPQQVIQERRWNEKLCVVVVARINSAPNL